MKKFLLLSLCFVSLSVQAQNKADYDALLERMEAMEAELAETKAEAEAATKAAEPKKSRLTLGGYGEVTMSRHFYSDSWKRYSAPTFYADDESYGRFDIPHAVFFVGYDFGKGWTFGSEIEFEHGGLEVAVEIEEEETGEYESEVENGGEVILEQFWINKESKFYAFGRYEFYDSMYKVEKSVTDKGYCASTCISGGVNYSPIREVTFKAEYMSRIFNSPYNNENTLMLGVTYTGLFKQ